MNLAEDDLKKLLKVALVGAEKAGSLIQKSFREKLNSKMKANSSSIAAGIVTEVDFESQRVLLEILTPSSQEFHLGLLTEEANDDGSRLKKDFFWCIDPLDGTLPYIENKSGYSVAISLISQKGIPYLGVIYDPRKNEIYHGIKTRGAYRNRYPLDLDKTRFKEKTFTLITDRSFSSHPLYEKFMLCLKRITERFGFAQVQVICQGGASMNAMWVIEKYPAAYVKLPKTEVGGGCIWDFAASCCIFNEMNLWVSDVYGNDLHFNNPDSIYFNDKGVLYSSEPRIAQDLVKEMKGILHTDT